MRNKSIDLETIAEGLDISPSLHKLAIDRYNGIAGFLNKKGINATFYSEGSFRTGTVVRPLKDGKERNFDLDVICELTARKSSITAYRVKKSVGEALKSNMTYNKILLPEDNVCWTLEYAESQDGIGFNLDVVPAVIDEAHIGRLLTSGVDYKYAQEAISVTERKTAISYDWLSSNPSGFGLWFDDINYKFLQYDMRSQKERIFQQYRYLFQSNENVEDVPDYFLRSPLQRVIQLLKRHRDQYFARTPGLFEYRPKSVVITFLASKIAQDANPQGLESLLKCIVQGLYEYAVLLDDNTPKSLYTAETKNIISKHGSTWCVMNPVDPEDNFTGDWTDRTAKAFFDWIKVVKYDLADTITSDEKRYLTGLQTSFGKDYISKQLNLDTSTQSYKAPVAIQTPIKPWRL